MVEHDLPRRHSHRHGLVNGQPLGLISEAVVARESKGRRIMRSDFICEGNTLKKGGQGRDRTVDLPIFSRTLVFGTNDQRRSVFAIKPLIARFFFTIKMPLKLLSIKISHFTTKKLQTDRLSRFWVVLCHPSFGIVINIASQRYSTWNLQRCGKSGRHPALSKFQHW